MEIFKKAQGRVKHSLRYRPEIDGLRALAVLAVVFYHAGLGCPGGYVGVDVFFVLSGYLITSLLIRDLNTDKFSMWNFWERRIRRIFPAVMVMVIITMIVALCWPGIVLLPGEFERLGKTAIAQALMVANIYFWKATGDYFGADAESSPFLHTWSLAVEEQFYFVFPLILWLVFYWSKGEERTKKNLLYLISAGIILSLGLAVVAVADIVPWHFKGMRWNATAAFFWLPARAWELLLGALIAVLPAKAQLRGKVSREMVSWFGLFLLIFPIWWYSKETPFPGWAALPPCLGAAMLIWANNQGHKNEEGRQALTSVGRFLALPVLVWIGLVSYSFYLWHWPIFTFVKTGWEEGWNLPSVRFGLLLFSLGCAAMSWKYVETPFRTRKVAAQRKSVFIGAATVSLIVLLTGIGLWASKGFPERFPELVQKNFHARTDVFPLEPVQRVSASPKGERGSLYPLFDTSSDASKDSRKILLWGDSHALHLIPAMQDWCQENRLQGYAAVYQSTPPLLDAAFSIPQGLNVYTFRWTREMFQWIQENQVTDVFLAGFWGDYQEIDALLLKTSLENTIRKLDALGCRVWVIQDFPEVDQIAPKMLALNALGLKKNLKWTRSRSEHYERNRVIYELAEADLPARFLDPSPLLLDQNSNHYLADIEGVAIYHDDDHLTITAAKRLFYNLLEKIK